MPEEWPIAASAADQSPPARRAGGDRLSTVRVDFFLAPPNRLSEQERALMTAMLHCLVSDIADELRAALPNLASPANDEGNLALIDLLSSVGLLDRAGLVRLLLRRADEERIATGAKARAGRREARVIQGLVSHRRRGDRRCSHDLDHRARTASRPVRSVPFAFRRSAAGRGARAPLFARGVACGRTSPRAGRRRPIDSYPRPLRKCWRATTREAASSS